MIKTDSYYHPTRTIVLVGMMGAGKSSIGRRLARELGLPFYDSDVEIEKAAGYSIAELFNRFGDAEFRAGERRVVGRLLREMPLHVLATGGGAYADEETRAAIKEFGWSVWLRADLDILVGRTSRRMEHRPILQQGDPRDILAGLLEQRNPLYAEADVTVDTGDRPAEQTVREVIEGLHAFERKRHG